MNIKTIFTVSALSLGLLAGCGGGGNGNSNKSSSTPTTSSQPAASSLAASSLQSSATSSAAFNGLVIEAEDYLRFYDTTPGNTTNEYRQDAVDIEKTSDQGGGYNIGYIDAGDWLEFSLEVTTPGTFSIESRVASAQSGGALLLEIDGKAAAEQIAVSATGDWQTWASINTAIGDLAVGNYALCIQMKSGPFNLNWLKLTSANGGAVALNNTPKGAESSCIHPVEPPKVTVPDRIKLNQLGFTPNAEKLAVVPAVDATRFTVVKAGTGEQVLSGDLSAGAIWEPALESVKLADLSSLSSAGDYELRVAGVAEAAKFSIATNAYDAVNAAALKAY